MQNDHTLLYTVKSTTGELIMIAPIETVRDIYGLRKPALDRIRREEICHLHSNKATGWQEIVVSFVCEKWQVLGEA